MTHLLSATHFRTRPRLPISAIPSAAKLSPLLAESISRSLGGLCAAPWRVMEDRIEETSTPVAGAFMQRVRFESEAGSLTACLALDRPVIAALMEALMGGAGTEASFDIGDRPFSAIEKASMEYSCREMADSITEALSHHFARPFTCFHEENSGTAQWAAQDSCMFRILIGVFGYSGEIHVYMARGELMCQVNAAGEGVIAEHESTAHQLLQEQVRKSAVDFMVTLGAETFSVEYIASLRRGQMVELSSTVSTPVTLWSGGVAAFQGSLARSGDHLAILITAPVR